MHGRQLDVSGYLSLVGKGVCVCKSDPLSTAADLAAGDKRLSQTAQSRSLQPGEGRVSNQQECNWKGREV